MSSELHATKQELSKVFTIITDKDSKQDVLYKRRQNSHDLFMCDTNYLAVLELIHGPLHLSAREMLESMKLMGITANRLTKKLANFILSCKECKTSKIAKSEITNLTCRPIPSRPWDAISLDHIQMGQGAKSLISLLVMDKLTRAIATFPVQE